MSIATSAIVVGVDGSPSAIQALDWATDQATAEHRGLTLVHALGKPTPAWTDIGLANPRAAFAALEREGRCILDQAAARVADRAPGLAVQTVLEFGDARDLLIRESEHAALLVVGSRGRGPIRSLLLGSVGVAVSRHALCPVVVHRPFHRGLVRNGVLVATDAGEGSREVVEFAFRLASVRRLPLTVLHCTWDVENLRDTRADASTAGLAELGLAESMAGLGEEYPDVVVTKNVVTGPAEARVNRAAEKMDVLVVGPHRRAGLKGALQGSVAMSLVEHALVPVAVVPIAAS